MRNTWVRSAVVFGICWLVFPRPVPAQLPAPSASAVPAVPTVPANNAAAPKIQFASPIYDYGRVNAGEIVRVQFVFTNIGNALLEVTDVQPGCHCTVAGNWDKKVEPGKTGTIPLEFNTAGYSGEVLRAVSVVCNDPAQPNISLQFKGTVWKPIDVTPTYVFFNLVPEAPTNEVRTVRIVNNQEGPITLSDLRSSNPAFLVTLKTNQPGKEFELQITPTNAPSDSGTLHGQITVRTSSTNMPSISVTAQATVTPAILAAPNQIFLPTGPLVNETFLTNTIRNNLSSPLTLSEPAVSDTNVQVRIQEIQPGTMFTAILTFPAGFVLPPGTPAQFTVKTSNPRMPLLTVPIRQFQPPTAVRSVPVPPVPPPAIAALPPIPQPPPQPPPPWLVPGMDVPGATNK